MKRKFTIVSVFVMIFICVFNGSTQQHSTTDDLALKSFSALSLLTKKYSGNRVNSVNIRPSQQFPIANNAFKVDSTITSTFTEGQNHALQSTCEMLKYNSRGQCTMVEYFSNSTPESNTAIWSPSSKIIIQYNENGYYTGNLGYYWSNTQKKYLQSADVTYYYAENQTDIDSVIWLVDYSGQGNLKPYDRWVRVPASEDKPEQQFFYNGEDSTWVLTARRELFKNAQGNDTVQITYDYKSDSNSWEKDYKQCWIYDSLGNLKSTITYNWSESKKQWLLDERTSYKYNGQGEITEKIESDGDYNTGEEELQRKIETWFNTVGQIDSVLVRDYDLIGENWENDRRTIYEYKNGNQVSETHYEWDRWDEIWENSSKKIYKYNESILCDAQYYNRFPDITIGVEHKHLLTDKTSLEWDSKQNSFVQQFNIHYYSSEHTSTSFAKTQQLEYILYPNPASSVISIQSGVGSPVLIQIFDLNGRRLIEQECTWSNEIIEIDVTNLQNGIYLCTIIFRDQSITKKLVVKK